MRLADLGLQIAGNLVDNPANTIAAASTMHAMPTNIDHSGPGKRLRRGEIVGGRTW
jgi:hypothetical protein